MERKVIEHYWHVLSLQHAIQIEWKSPIRILIEQKKSLASVPHIETLTSSEVAALTENKIGGPKLA